MEENKQNEEKKYRVVNISEKKFKLLEEIKKIKQETKSNIVGRLIEEEYNKLKQDGGNNVI